MIHSEQYGLVHAAVWFGFFCGIAFTALLVLAIDYLTNKVR